VSGAAARAAGRSAWAASRGPRLPRRASALLLAGLSLLAILAVAAGAFFLGEAGLRTNLSARAEAPSLLHPFGTDLLGRDVFARTVKGLTLSLGIGFAAATISALLALALALAAATGGRRVDAAVGFLVDMGLALPHLLLLILISFALGGGRGAVVIAVALTHWPRLARILRAEIGQVLGSDYVRLSRRFGRSEAFVARHHLLPHLLPQLLVGALLLLPHAILHEAGLTFLGFGLEPSTPAIGVMLAEAMRSLTAGLWWLGVFPGLALLLVVLALDGAGSGLRALVSPRERQD
jgi:peptide/nickel transport system permease protein